MEIKLTQPWLGNTSEVGASLSLRLSAKMLATWHQGQRPAYLESRVQTSGWLEVENLLIVHVNAQTKERFDFKVSPE